MDPRLDDKERELRERARQAAGPLRDAAAAIDADDETPRALLAGLGEAGLLGICLPSAHGGGDGGRIEAALVCEEIGAASAGAAALVVAHLVAASLIEAAAGPQAAEELLPALARGETIAATALDGAVSLLDEPAVSLDASAADDGLDVNGTAGAVPGATIADLLVVPARAGGDGELLIGVLEAEATGVTRKASPRKMGLNGSAMGKVQLEGARARRLVGGNADEALAAARDLARVAHAALCVGIARAALEAATAHAGGSEALERSQSVQWMLADSATETEAARLLTWYAASRRAAGELREAAAMARLIGAEAAVASTRRALQVLGAAGNEGAGGIERLYRDAKAMEIHQGAAEAQRVAVARQLLPDLFEDAAAG